MAVVTAPTVAPDQPRIRPWVAIAALVVVTVALVARLAMIVIADRDERAALQMRDVASRIPVPAGFTTLRRVDCPDVADLVGCWTTPQSPDQLALSLRTALMQAAGGHKVTGSCETILVGHEARSCSLRYDRGDHVVLVLIDSNVKMVDGHGVLMGSRVRIDAL